MPEKLLTLFVNSAAFFCKASAQTFNVEVIKANLGKTKTLCVVDKIFSDTLTLIKWVAIIQTQNIPSP